MTEITDAEAQQVLDLVGPDDLADEFRALMADMPGHPVYSLEETLRNSRILDALQALADVRTLDEWAGDYGWSAQHMTEFTSGKPVGFLVLHGNSDVKGPPAATSQGAKAVTELEAALARAQAAFDALTPEQQAAHRREQAIDWAYGQLMATTNHREGVTRERIAELYDQRKGALADELTAEAEKLGMYKSGR